MQNFTQHPFILQIFFKIYLLIIPITLNTVLSELNFPTKETFFPFSFVKLSKELKFFGFSKFPFSNSFLNSSILFLSKPCGNSEFFPFSKFFEFSLLLSLLKSFLVSGRFSFGESFFTTKGRWSKLNLGPPATSTRTFVFYH